MKARWWKQECWTGCRLLPSNLHRLCATATPGIDLPNPVGWQEYAIPTINQHGPSCCGQAWANWMELMVRRYIGHDAIQPGEQIDGYAIWKRARELYYHGSLTGGLYLGQGYGAALDLGIIPPGSILVDLDPDLLAIATQLHESPVVQGHLVSDGWMEPNPQNGGLDESKLPTPADGGHATLLMGYTTQEDRPFIVSQNSWGDAYGFHGYFTMSWDFWCRCYLGDGPVTAKLPAGWESWSGWKKFITRNAQ